MYLTYFKLSLYKSSFEERKSAKAEYVGRTEDVNFKVISPPLKGGIIAIKYFKLAISGVVYVFFKGDKKRK